MNMGLSVHQVVDETELRRKAKERKEASDEVLENVYSMLLVNLKKKDNHK